MFDKISYEHWLDESIEAKRLILTKGKYEDDYVVAQKSLLFNITVTVKNTGERTVFDTTDFLVESLAQFMADGYEAQVRNAHYIRIIRQQVRPYQELVG